MKKRGFTLIELLAVITVLAIISLIAVPLMINVINSSKEESLKKSIRLYIDAVENNISNAQVANPDYVPEECIIQSNGNVICYLDDEELKQSDGSVELKIQVKGKAPKSGKIEISDGLTVDILDIEYEEKYFNFDSKGDIVFYSVPMPTEAGLYDEQRKLLATWKELEDYGMDVEFDNNLYTSHGYSYLSNATKTIPYVMNNNKLSEGKLLVISANITKIGNYAFWKSNLTHIVFEKNSQLEGIGHDAFRGSDLISITIPNSITSIGYAAFNGCSELTSITIPNSVTSIGNYAFNGCSGLTSITIPNSVTSIGSNAFEGCSGLTSITIPNSVTSIGSYAFSGSGLISIIIPKSVTHLGDINGSNIFSNCKNLSSIKVEKENPIYEDRDSNAIIIKSNNTLISGCKNTIIPNSITSIEHGAFSGCSGLTSITIPNSVTSIGEAAFNGCSELASITIPNSVTSIGEAAFYGCSELTSITIPNSVTSIGEAAFYGCSELTSITIPNSVTSIGEAAFYGCSELTSITIPNSVTSIGNYAFNGCRNLTSVIFNNTTGWFITNLVSATTGDSIDVTNASTNATNLVNTYSDKYWKRN